MSKTLLGEILLHQGLITQAQLNQALQLQHQAAEKWGWKFLGEVLVEAGFISQATLEEAIGQQARLNELELFELRSHPSTRNALKRLIDIVGAVLGLAVMLLLLPWIAIAIYLESPGPIFVSQPRVGLRGRQFQLWRFRTTFPEAERIRLAMAHQKPDKFFDQAEDPDVTRVGRFLRRFYLDELPQFFNVLKGEMSLVGTRPPTLDEVKHYTEADWLRLVVKPGITGFWQINRRKYQMQFDQVLDLDFSYINHWRPGTDLWLLSRTLVHVLVGPQSDKIDLIEFSAGENRIGILNVPIDNLSIKDLLEQLDQGVVVTPNVDHLIKLQKDPEFYQTYQQADYRVCDSQILMYASRFLGTPLKEKISGSDFFPTFCEYHRNNPDIRIFLLGSAPGVAEKAKARINQRVGREIVVMAHSPSFGFEKNFEECQKIVNLINQSGATVLAIGVGSPKGENWLCKYKSQMPNVKIFLGIGATIDFEAGIVKRAPKWVSQIGVEWLFRIINDPKRLWKRYLVEDLPFFWLLFQQKLGLYKPPTFNRQTNSLLYKDKRKTSLSTKVTQTIQRNT